MGIRLPLRKASVDAVADASVEVAAIPAHHSSSGKVALKSEADPIIDRVHDIENLNRTKALERVGQLEDAAWENYFQLGGVLSRIKNEKWFAPCPTFDKWVEAETAMGRSKARALIQIYDCICAAEVSWEQVKEIHWTKLRHVAPVMTKDSAEHWIEVAKANSRSKLPDIVKKYKADHADETPPEAQTASHVQTFRFYDDQNESVQTALKKAMDEAGTDKPSEAISLICLDYLAGVSLVDRLKGLGPHKAYDALTTAFPDTFMISALSGEGDE